MVRIPLQCITLDIGTYTTETSCAWGGGGGGGGSVSL